MIGSSVLLVRVLTLPKVVIITLSQVFHEGSQRPVLLEMHIIRTVEVYGQVDF